VAPADARTVTDHSIRPARAEEAGLLPAIEAEAARLFAAVGIPALAGARPHDTAFYLDAMATGTVLVALPAASADGEDAAGPVGFAAIALRDGAAWLAELGVLPAHARRGLGRRLTLAAIAWAEQRGLPEITLTTFRDLPNNGRFYATLGFREVDPGRGRPHLAAVRKAERRAGLDRLAPRVAMALALGRNKAMAKDRPGGA